MACRTGQWRFARRATGIYGATPHPGRESCTGASALLLMLPFIRPLHGCNRPLSIRIVVASRTCTLAPERVMVPACRCSHGDLSQEARQRQQSTICAGITAEHRERSAAGHPSQLPLTIASIVVHHVAPRSYTDPRITGRERQGDGKPSWASRFARRRCRILTYIGATGGGACATTSVARATKAVAGRLRWDLRI